MPYPRIVQVSSYDVGGAAKAAVRTHKSLVAAGVPCSLLVLYAREALPLAGFELLSSDEHNAFPPQDPHSTYRQHRARIQGRKPGSAIFSLCTSDYRFLQHSSVVGADIIHLHWVADLLDYPSFFTKNTKPTLWTLHDQNPFTGGCHYSEGCRQYETYCDTCPQLQGAQDQSCARETFETKLGLSERFKTLHIATPSRWLGELAKQSRLFRNATIHHVPNGIDLGTFFPHDKSSARERLALPKEKKLFLFLSPYPTSHWKGLDFLIETFSDSDTKDNAALMVLGGTPGKLALPPGSIHRPTDTNDEAIRDYYAAADAVVIPSREENYPNVALEAIACGRPVLCFPTGGLPEIVVDDISGYVAQAQSADALNLIIKKFLAAPDVFDSFTLRKHAEENFSKELQAKRYLDVYAQMQRH